MLILVTSFILVLGFFVVVFFNFLGGGGGGLYELHYIELYILCLCMCL